MRIVVFVAYTFINSWGRFEFDGMFYCFPERWLLFHFKYIYGITHTFQDVVKVNLQKQNFKQLHAFSFLAFTYT